MIEADYVPMDAHAGFILSRDRGGEVWHLDIVPINVNFADGPWDPYSVRVGSGVRAGASVFGAASSTSDRLPNNSVSLFFVTLLVAGGLLGGFWRRGVGGGGVSISASRLRWLAAEERSVTVPTRGAFVLLVSRMVNGFVFGACWRHCSQTASNSALVVALAGSNSVAKASSMFRASAILGLCAPVLVARIFILNFSLSKFFGVLLSLDRARIFYVWIVMFYCSLSSPPFGVG